MLRMAQYLRNGGSAIWSRVRTLVAPIRAEELDNRCASAEIPTEADLRAARAAMEEVRRRRSH